MSDDQFMKLYVHMEKNFALINRKLDEKASQASVDRLYDAIDSLSGRVDALELELGAIKLQLKRIVHWARRASPVIGVSSEGL